MLGRKAFLLERRGFELSLAVCVSLSAVEVLFRLESGSRVGEVESLVSSQLRKGEPALKFKMEKVSKGPRGGAVLFISYAINL